MVIAMEIGNGAPLALIMDADARARAPREIETNRVLSFADNV